MSKYDAPWVWIRQNGSDRFSLTFAEIGKIAGVPRDHSFLKYKQEPESHGDRIGKISLKAKTVTFCRLV